jgi:hypothetical protein
MRRCLTSIALCLLLGDDVLDTNAYDVGGGQGVRFMY